MKHYSYRKFKVNLNGKETRKKCLQNGLPQKSVTSPYYFNCIYCWRFKNNFKNMHIYKYTNNISLVTLNKCFDEVEKILDKNLAKLKMYFDSRQPLFYKKICTAHFFFLTIKKSFYLPPNTSLIIYTYISLS